MTYNLFQIVKYLWFKGYHHYLHLIVFYFQEEMETKLRVLYIYSSLEYFYQALHLILFFLLNLIIPLINTNNMQQKLYLFGVCALIFLLVLVHLIEKSCLVFVFRIFYLSILYQTVQKTFYTLMCLDFQYCFETVLYRIMNDF